MTNNTQVDISGIIKYYINQYNHTMSNVCQLPETKYSPATSDKYVELGDYPMLKIAVCEYYESVVLNE